jgi:hypothetical protein
MGGRSRWCVETQCFASPITEFGVLRRNALRLYDNVAINSVTSWRERLKFIFAGIFFS